MDTNIQKLFAFVTTVACGSFTRAAEKLAYSQSGISRMINDLENEWNVTLLERGRSGVRLTSEGTALLSYAENVCSAYNTLHTQVDEMKGLQSGLIRIGTFSSVATHWLPGIIKAFQKDYPKIHYELLLGDYTEIESWIMEGRIDCGFLRSPTHNEFDSIMLEKDHFMVIMPEGHPFSNCDRFPITTLQDYPFMLLEKDENMEVRRLLDAWQITPQINFITWDDYAIMSMVESGLGISILPALVLRRSPYRIVAKEPSIPAHREICLAMKNKTAASAATKRFIEYLAYRESGID